jgi:hydroxyacylglutathione hydrolase
MKIEQIYTGCLAHAAYYLESNGEAAIFDPLREVQPYINRAEADNAKINMFLKLTFMPTLFQGIWI